MSAPCPIFGFVIEIEPERPLPIHALNALVDALLQELLAPRGLIGRAAEPSRPLSLIVTSEASQATDADRVAIAAWAAARPEVSSVRLGPLVDLAAVA